MEFQLEVKKYQDRVAELESAVDKLQRELALSRQAKSEAADQTSSESEAATAADQTNANNIEGTSAGQQEQVNTSLFAALSWLIHMRKSIQPTKQHSHFAL